MAPLYYAPEDGAKYVLVGPDGSRCVFNDDVDPDFCGVNTAATGLDSPDVTTSSSTLVEADGGYNGIYYYGMRPMTFSGQVYKFSDIPGRNLQLSKIMRASNAMQYDGLLHFSPSWRVSNVISNPSFEYGLAPWVLSGAGAISTQTDWAISGSHSGGLVGTTSSGSPYSYASQYVLVTGGAKYNMQATFDLGTPSATVVPQIQVAWLDKAGGLISNGVLSAAPNVSGVQTLVGQLTAPDNAYSAYYSVGLSYSGGYGAFNTRVDGLLMSREGSAFFDGDTSGNYWFGTPGNSPSGNSIPMYTPFRRQQPLRISGSWVKDFQVAIVSQFSPLFSYYQVATTPAASVTAENYGNYPAYPVIRVFGPSAGAAWSVVNTTTGQYVEIDGPGAIGGGQFVDIDVLNHVAVLSTGTSWNRYINFANSTWPTVTPNGLSSWATSDGSNFQLTYRHSWV